MEIDPKLCLPASQWDVRLSCREAHGKILSENPKPTSEKCTRTGSCLMRHSGAVDMHGRFETIESFKEGRVQ